MNRNDYRRTWLRLHRSYERKAYGMFRKNFQDLTRRMPFSLMNETNYKAMVELTALNGDIERTYHEVYRQIGLMHGERVGNSINKEIKDFGNITFQSEFIRGLYQWVLENVGYRITTVKETFIKYIQGLIADGFKDGLTIREISDNIFKLVNRRDFYRWQSLRIARTETTAAANHGALRAGSSSGILLDKVWISATDARTRRLPDDTFDHLHMNGVKVPLDSYFEVQGKFGVEKLPFPGSPTNANGNQSNGSDVINCRCTVAEVPRRDANGRIVRVNNFI